MRKAMPMVIKNIKKTRKVQKTLQLATCSDLRRGILVSLKEDKKALSELRDELGISSTTAIHALRELEKDNLLFQNTDRNYALTQIGEVIALKLTDFINTIEVLKKHERFWLEHDLSGIPINLLSSLTALYNCELIQTNIALDETHHIVIDIFESAEEKIVGISPVITLNWAKVIIEQANRGIKIILITTDNVLKMSSENKFKDYSPLDHPNIYFRINNDLRLGFASNEKIIALALFDNKRNNLDMGEVLTCSNLAALEWGERLFNDFKKKSQNLNNFQVI